MNLAAHRLHNQRLVRPAFDAAEEVVRWLGAVQAQDYHGAKWGLALRTRGADNAALDRAFSQGAFLRTHVMRPTWHFVAPEDLRWLLALTSPRVHAANAHRYRQLELDEALFRRAHRIFASALQGGRALTRRELADRLEAAGIPARGQRLAYIVMHAELDGLICSGPLRGKQHTYALLDERVPPAPALPRDEALATLTRRYFRSHGPATVHDFAWWSGLTVSDAKAALEMVGSELEAVAVDRATYWTDAAAVPTELAEPIVHLLPNYDEHVVAYKDHAPSLDPRVLTALRTWAVGPPNAHLIARNGLVVGGWRRTLAKHSVVVKLELLVELSTAEHDLLASAAEEYGRFMGMPAVLEGAR